MAPLRDQTVFGAQGRDISRPYTINDQRQIR